MKRLLIAVVLVGIAGSAWAQTPPAAQQGSQRYDESKRYVAVNVGGTFGNKTSSTFGAEVGFKVGDIIEIFAEGGRMTDVTTSATETAASTIASTFLGTLGKGAASWTTKTPANYGAVGARYLFPMTGNFEPYLALTLGVANVEKKVSFALNGADVTGSLATYGVQVGNDLGGQTNNAMVTFGGGVRMPFGRILVDVGGRYGRIFTSPGGTNVLRLSAGVGFKF